MMISIIVAQALNRVIGKNNQLPWHLSDDLKFFKKTTQGHAVIMGRNTFESIGKPLPQRINIVITRSSSYHVEGVTIVHSLDEAIAQARSIVPDEGFIIGGGGVFHEALSLADRLYVTEVQAVIDGDTFFPVIDSAEWEEVSRQFFSASAVNTHDFYTVCLDRISFSKS